MKKIIFILLFTLVSFANEANTNDISDEFDSEFASKTKEVFDPLSGYNRVMTSFNDKFYIYVLAPTARGYAYVVPETARIGIDNFFTNLFFPIRFTNNLLQLKFQNASEELGRFLMNTIWGLGGFMDPATNELDMKIHKEDFGQTLGFYGVGEGFHIVLPFLGPSNLRDLTGLVAGEIISPTSTIGEHTFKYKIPNNTLEEFGLVSLYKINEFSFNPNQYEIIKKDALDLYPFLRDIYNQSRQKQIEE
ncbi:VacJ family lipoprotein [Aliarcobacter butzleri]|uniref:MlaA family lipoprotein n=1 Tax=Aliarcobacter butzleri TaxID=28197 RepID=UPI001EDAF813|nr:VacJ family lipoprotein [Aliarcobacter butzleri]MCG3687811.1 VacJ family lipoprotein [Aliarcobacter butzleri]MCT7562961.1 VacJ family lipoprotein [Aliarcobacter butzleri]MCT7601982.1 VacJ family lipoprotein [Aliarcobacter butzleri]MCT7606123.1 VacJ family lipoprotein [Aliarcobacter butzleri]MCT7608468.1 VacJ family lipoprotein [Aliarcobacter butzleri]